ncbi:MAG: hypothetical protein L0219_05430, partial [Phycisphaerales bacterium]|nr:hypothetical protein [Phycisphaerales bacterium]
MPRLARFKIAAIEDLLRQLEYAPAETRARQMDAVERLIGDVDPAQNYPHEYVLFRITGYRSDRVDEPVTYVGQALLSDLTNLVQVLSQGLELPADYAGRRAFSMEQAAERMQISPKTMQRYRKQGLVCHYVQFGDSEGKLACFEDAIERFVQRHKGRLDKAAAFTRIDGDVRGAIIERARTLRQSERLTLNQAAGRLAQEHNRARETIRIILRRQDRTAAEPIFSERGPLTDREILVAHRAWQRGIEPARLAQRLGKTKATVHRAVNHRRRELLNTLKLHFVTLPTFRLADAAAVILSAPAAVSDLRKPPGDANALSMIEGWREASPTAVDDEHAVLAAYNFLKMRASTGISKLGRWPRSEQLDQIETDLRWAALLRWKSIVLGMPAAIERIEQNLRRPLSSQPTEHILSMLKLGFAVVSSAIETIDPARGRGRGRGERVERIAGFAMERALAQLDSRG